MSRRVVILSLASFSLIAGGVGWSCRQNIKGWWDQTMEPVALTHSARPKPDPRSYEVLVSELRRWRGNLAGRYSSAKSMEERQAVEHDARIVLEEAMPAMMRCWLGTPWDFHGTAEGPGKGKIACGYFVSTVLKDAGFQVDRYKLAQQASENILRSFLKKDACKLTMGESYDSFADGISHQEPGIYVVGLDTHVAFIVVEQGEFRFIHSSGSSPWCVVDEGRDDAHVLQKSNWRMLGNLTGDRGVIRIWLKGEKVSVQGT